jgi:hypothetical protein
MSKSIMVEVDETTKSVLEMLEYKMTSGVDSKLQSYKSENDFALQSLYSRLQLQLEETGKSIAKENEKSQRKLDDLLHDLEDQLEDIKDQLNDAKKEQATALQTSIDSLNLVRNELKGNLESRLVDHSKESLKQMDMMTTAVKEMEKRIEYTFSQLQEELNQQKEMMAAFATKESLAPLADKKSLSEAGDKLAESLNVKLDGIESRFNVRQDIQLIVNKLDKLEQELAWANQPFYKKWFMKRV